MKTTEYKVTDKTTFAEHLEQIRKTQAEGKPTQTTQTTGHTPGPWKAARRNEDYDGPMFEMDAEEAPCPFVRIYAANGQAVVSCHDLATITAANARLIAAAPELLAMLKTLEMELHALSNSEQLGSVGRAGFGIYLANARHLIAKAEGRA